MKKQHHHSKGDEAILLTANLRNVDPDLPLRLSTAALLAFPDNTMSASSLRREVARGRLTIEKIAGKQFTTLNNIQRMRELCRVEAKVQDSIDVPLGRKSAEKQSGLSATAVGPTAARDALLARLTKRHPTSRNRP